MSLDSDSSCTTLEIDQINVGRLVSSESSGSFDNKEAIKHPREENIAP